MKPPSEEAAFKDDIKKEFQVERMILFSDAVFAIVITLMAIEIKIPDTGQRVNQQMLAHELRKLLPFVLAYLVSFFFIGTVWYQHLKIFSLVKDYNKQLVVRNLALLFFIGLFPFCVSVITRSEGDSIAFLIYLGIIVSCIVAQYLLHRYIVSGPPEIRFDIDMDEQYLELRKKKILVIGFSVATLLAASLYLFSDDPDVHGLAPLLVLPVVLVYRVLLNRMKKQRLEPALTE